MPKKLTRKDVTVSANGVVRKRNGGYPLEIGVVYRCRVRGFHGWWVFEREGKESFSMWRRRKNALAALLDEVNRNG